MVVDPLHGEGEDDQESAGEAGGGTELFGGDDVDDDTGTDGEDIIVIDGTFQTGHTLLQKAGTVNSQVGTEERGEEGTRERGGDHGVTDTGVVSLGDGVGEVVGPAEVAGDVGRDKPVDEEGPGNGGDEDVHVPVQVLENHTRHGAHTEGEGDAQVTEAAHEGQTDGSDEGLRLPADLGDNTGGEKEGENLLEILGVQLEGEERDEVI